MWGMRGIGGDEGGRIWGAGYGGHKRKTRKRCVSGWVEAPYRFVFKREAL
jgi:hypothetical protein